MTTTDPLARHCGALAACRRCGHDEGSALPVLSTARDARVMLVGQAPGKSEATDRRPFTGRAGRTLFRWLADAGLTETDARAHIYIGAVTRCYPGPHASGRGDRVPSLRERALCAPWLAAELAIIRPRLLIPVGRLAIERLVGARPLAEVVGRAFTVAHGGGGSRVVPLPHPSGASSWIHAPGHQALLRGAIAILTEEFTALGLPNAAPSFAREGAA